MTEPSSPKPDNTSADDNLKGLIIKGIVGAVTLAGATGIPLIVQKYLGPSTPPPTAEAPAPATSPAPAVTTAPPAAAPVAAPPAATEAAIAPEEKGKGKRKKPKD